MKNTIITILIIIILGVAGAYFLQKNSPTTTIENYQEEKLDTETATSSEDVMIKETQDETETIIGQSVEGRDIVAYHYTADKAESEADTDVNVDTEILFIGGIHGGYSWNTALVAYEAMDYFEENKDSIPSNVKVTVIPTLNPDGQNKVVKTAERFEASDVPSSTEEKIAGRFNANNVDLNRNFDCDWQAEGTWQSRKVSGGTSAFSEPETEALKNYIESNDVSAVIAWYSSAGGVFTSNCHNGVLPETDAIAEVYADASGYKKFEDFDFYEVTGDMTNWLAGEGVPAISILLSTHESTEWAKNEKGIAAILNHYAK